MKISLLAVILFLACYSHSFGQEHLSNSRSVNRKPFFVGLDLGYNTGIGNVNVIDDVKYKNSGYLIRARILAGGFVSSNLAISGGFGMEGYHSPTYNLFPVFADLRYFVHPDQKSLFFKGNLGYSVGLSSNFEQGLYTGFGVGYSLYGRKIRTQFSIGFDFHQIKDDEILVIYPDERIPEYVQATVWLKSLAFGIGFFF